MIESSSVEEREKGLDQGLSRAQIVMMGLGGPLARVCSWAAVSPSAMRAPRWC